MGLSHPCHCRSHSTDHLRKTSLFRQWYPPWFSNLCHSADAAKGNSSWCCSRWLRFRAPHQGDVTSILMDAGRSTSFSGPFSRRRYPSTSLFRTTHQNSLWINGSKLMVKPSEERLVAVAHLLLCQAKTYVLSKKGNKCGFFFSPYALQNLKVFIGDVQVSQQFSKGNFEERNRNLKSFQLLKGPGHKFSSSLYPGVSVGIWLCQRRLLDFLDAEINFHSLACKIIILFFFHKVFVKYTKKPTKCRETVNIAYVYLCLKAFMYVLWSKTLEALEKPSWLQWALAQSLGLLV